jgi:hypothetical protein
MGKRHSSNKEILETWFGGRFYLDHLAHCSLHLLALGIGQQGFNCARTCRVTHRSNARKWAVGNQTQDHCVCRIDVRAEGTGKTNVGYLWRPGMLDEQVDACT